MNVCDNLGDHLVGNVYVKVSLSFTLLCYYSALHVLKCEILSCCQDAWGLIHSLQVYWERF